VRGTGEVVSTVRTHTTTTGDGLLLEFIETREVRDVMTTRTTTIERNGRGWILSKTESDSDLELERHEYTYDDEGLVASAVSYEQGQLAETHEFSYDTLGRLLHHQKHTSQPRESTCRSDHSYSDDDFAPPRDDYTVEPACRMARGSFCELAN
jgi:hypothetical protein